MATDRTRIVRVAAAALIVVGLVAAGSAVAARLQDRQGRDLNVTYMDGYPLDRPPGAAAAFSGNEIIVVAQVTELLPSRWNTASPSPTKLAFIFTPTRVGVREVLRGSPRLDNGTMVVRQLGGQVGDDKYVAADDISTPLALRSEYVLFLGEQRDLGDGLDAATPNLAYLLDATDIARSADGEWKIDLAGLRTMIASSVPH